MLQRSGRNSTVWSSAIFINKFPTPGIDFIPRTVAVPLSAYHLRWVAPWPRNTWTRHLVRVGHRYQSDGPVNIVMALAAAPRTLSFSAAGIHLVIQIVGSSHRQTYPCQRNGPGPYPEAKSRSTRPVHRRLIQVSMAAGSLPLKIILSYVASSRARPAYLHTGGPHDDFPAAACLKSDAANTVTGCLRQRYIRGALLTRDALCRSRRNVYRRSYHRP